MRRTQQKGLSISKQNEMTASSGVLLPLLVFAAGNALMALTGISMPWLPALAGAALCLLELPFGKRKWFRSGALALLVLSLVLLRGRILDGFCQWFNGVGGICTAERGIVLPELESSGDDRSIQLFACWTSVALATALVLLRQWGMEAVGASALLLCGGASLALGRMFDPLPLVVASAMLCSGRSRKHSILPVAIVAAAALLALNPGIANWAGAQSEAALRQIHHHRYETGYTTLPEGRLEPLPASDATALIVTMEKPEVLYLRGYTGAELVEGRWQPLDPGILGENRDLLYWLNSREFDLRAQFEAAASSSETRKNTVTVQNVGACSAYRYIPFSICTDERLIPENLTETAAGGRYDSFTTVYGGAAMLPELVEALETEDSRYLVAEAAYREFVEAHYLHIPEEMAQKLQPHWDSTRGMDAQNAVKAVLESCFPDGVGHDPYYATAAVLTLRHFGIPARYAEGYILPVTTATTVELTGRHAACWAEVYHDGIGWIPMALTPGLEGEEEQQEETTLPPDTPEQTLPPETEPQTETEPEGGYRVRIARALVSIAVIGLLLVLLLVLLLLLRRRYILKKRQAILNQEDIREAAAWGFADAVSVLEMLGIRRGNGSLDTLSTPIAQRLGASVAQQFEAASSVNARALFSGKPMTQAQLEAVLSFRSSVLAILQEKSNRLSRLWMKYILCRF